MTPSASDETSSASPYASHWLVLMGTLNRHHFYSVAAQCDGMGGLYKPPMDGTEFGDSMGDADMVELDGLGMGGEMTMAGMDFEAATDAKMEGGMEIEMAMDDGMMPQGRRETQRDTGRTIDSEFGIDPNDGLYE